MTGHTHVLPHSCTVELQSKTANRHSITTIRPERATSFLRKRQPHRRLGTRETARRTRFERESEEHARDGTYCDALRCVCSEEQHEEQMAISAGLLASFGLDQDEETTEESAVMAEEMLDEARFDRYGTREALDCKAQCTSINSCLRVSCTGPVDVNCAECTDGYARDGSPVGASCTLAATCSCSHGTAASGSNCPSDGAYKCLSCDAGYYLSGSTCSLKQCTCTHGSTSYTGTDCPTNGANKCSSCDAGFYLSDSSCSLNKCACDHGSSS